MSALSIAAVRTDQIAFRPMRPLRCALPLLALLLVGLGGCRQGTSAAEEDLEHTLHPITVEGLDINAERVTPGLGDPMEYSRTPRNGDVAVPSPVKPRKIESKVDPIENERALKYYTAICEIYWKLNWMRKELLRGSVPYNMLDEIEKARKRLKVVTHDGNYALAEEALDRMQKGLEHLACLQTMHTFRVDDLRVPWGSGAQGVQQYFDRNRSLTATPGIQMPPRYSGDTDNDEEDGAVHSMVLPRALEPTSGTMTLARRQAMALVLDYETRYHESPRLLMQSEWETAIRKTNRLRDNLALQNREENKDGDGADVEQAVSIAAGDYGTIHVPADAGKDGIAPARVEPKF